ncbi:hypothetical protein [Streptomyces tsukubensis]|uniref:Uncharacterized protein n=1 Tax=Streptomyces tsukubensis TaxID=83656 RepID=A0A1V4AC34_9ACTN|nr:hypothetical protein [Streptomyces tsukubensis]OON81019.1 hypothetical protein B1H18_09335 [Streptomyces tsukubensis]QFR94856.1 hypothetical protein GBW32_19705 [Streptomyces tsukubensis]
MTSHDELRLLPWSGPDGKPCYLSTGESGGYLSRLADNIESVQLGLANDFLEHALGVLSDRQAGPDGLRVLAMDMSGRLRDVLRVAVSRGHRLPS